MPGTPRPVVDPRFGPAWTPMVQAAQNAKQQNAALSAFKATIGAYSIETDQSGSLFTPINANDVEPVSSPTVTAQIGATGTALVTASGLVAVGATPTASMVGIIYFSYTPEGGTSSGPIEISRLGVGLTNISLGANITGVKLITAVPTGLVTFNMACESNGTQGATFTNLELTVQPQ